MTGIDFKPSNIHIYLASSCNLACTYCWNQGGTFGKSPAALMTADTARAVVEFVRTQLDRHQAPYFSFSLFGGEPLLNDEVVVFLIDALQGLRQKRKIDLRILLFSNGTIIHPAITARMRKKNYMEYHVGLDGGRRVHDAHRVDKAGRGTYERVSRNISSLLAQKVFVVAESVVPAPYDYLGLMQTYDALGIRFAFVQNEIKPIHGPQGSHFHIDPLDVESWQPRYKEFTRYYFKRILDGDAPLIDPLYNVTETLMPQSAPALIACTVGTSQISIASSGAIYACNQFQEIELFRLGDVFNGLDPDRYQAFAKLLLSQGRMAETHPQCRGCAIRLICKGGCYAANYAETGSMGEIRGAVFCDYRREKTAIDLEFAQRMLEKFPSYAEDVQKKNLAPYFPRLIGDAESD